MKIIWIYRVLADGHTHITTWRETYRHLRAKHEIHYIFPYEKVPKSFADHAILIKKVKWSGVAFVHYLLHAIVAFIQLNRTVQPDVVILDQFSALFSIIYAFRRNRPVIILDLRQAKYSNEGKWFAGRMLRGYTRLILRFNRRYQDGISYISEGLRQQILKDMQMPLNDNYLIWPSGVDPAIFAPPNARAADQQHKGFELFFHGSVTHDRGLAETIAALAMVRDRGLAMRFTIVGDGAYLSVLKSQAAKLGVDHLIDFKPLVPFDEIPALIAGADVCMMPYPISDYWEGNVPIKMLEYMAMEKVVLCTDLQAFRKITRSSSCARIIPDNAPETIAGALADLYSHRDRLSEWGQVGREIVKADYTWQAIAQHIDEFVEHTAMRRKRMHPPSTLTDRN